MFKFLKRLRAKKEEQQAQPGAEQTNDLRAEEQTANIAEAPIQEPKDEISSDMAMEPGRQEVHAESSLAESETAPEEIPQPRETSGKESKPTKTTVFMSPTRSTYEQSSQIGSYQARISPEELP